MKYFKIAICLFAIIMVIAGLDLYKSLYHSPKDAPSEIITIQKNQTVSQVITKLHRQGIIDSPFAMKLAVRLTGSDKHFRSGTFSFPKPSSPMNAIHILTQGVMVLTPIVVPEGFSMKDIASVLEKKDITSAEGFLAACKDPTILAEYEIPHDSAEGYLFPETYNFAKKSDPKLVVRVMIDHLFKKITDDHIGRAKSLNLNVHEWITLASIIEKEAANSTEYTTIASVFHNRLRKKMKLESDPTIIYGIPNYDGNIRRKHIRMPHAYNTYVIKALPPGPIASPGWGALEGTLQPKTTDYLFFVADKQRKHVFSKTYEEHKRNVQKYQLQ